MASGRVYPRRTATSDSIEPVRRGKKTPLANATVVLISPSGSVLAATTDSEGIYSFTVAPSQKTYRVIPSKDGYSFAPLDRTFAALIDDQKDVDFVASRP